MEEEVDEVEEVWLLVLLLELSFFLGLLRELLFVVLLYWAVCDAVRRVCIGKGWWDGWILFIELLVCVVIVEVEVDGKGWDRGRDRGRGVAFELWDTNEFVEGSTKEEEGDDEEEEDDDDDDEVGESNMGRGIIEGGKLESEKFKLSIIISGTSSRESFLFKLNSVFLTFTFSLNTIFLSSLIFKMSAFSAESYKDSN